MKLFIIFLKGLLGFIYWKLDDPEIKEGMKSKVNAYLNS